MYKLLALLNLILFFVNLNEGNYVWASINIVSGLICYANASPI